METTLWQNFATRFANDILNPFTPPYSVTRLVLKICWLAFVVETAWPPWFPDWNQNWHFSLSLHSVENVVFLRMSVREGACFDWGVFYELCSLWIYVCIRLGLRWNVNRVKWTMGNESWIGQGIRHFDPAISLHYQRAKFPLLVQFVVLSRAFVLTSSWWRLRASSSWMSSFYCFPFLDKTKEAWKNSKISRLFSPPLFCGGREWKERLPSFPAQIESAFSGPETADERAIFKSLAHSIWCLSCENAC